MGVGFPLRSDVIGLVILDRKALQLFLFPILFLPHLIKSQLELALPRCFAFLYLTVSSTEVEFVHSASGGLRWHAILRRENLRRRRELKTDVTQLLADLIHKSDILLKTVIR